MKNCDTRAHEKYDIETAFHTLDSILDSISKCDTKISYLLSAMSLVTIFEFNLIDFRFFKEHIFNDATFISVIVGLFFAVGAISTFISIFLATYSLNPKLKPLSESNGLETNSILYFGTISKMSFSKFQGKCKSITVEDQYHDILSQIYINSVIANKKYRLLHYNTICFMLSFISLLMFIIIQSIFF